MNELDIITNDSYLIIPSNIKKKVINYFNNKEKLLNTKIITIDELKRKLVFDYDEQSIFFLMENYNLSYNNALEYINNMYYLNGNEVNEKLKKLNIIKQELFNNSLIIKDDLFIADILSKKVYVYGFDIIAKFDNYLISKLNNVSIISKEENNYKHHVMEFKNINEEIEYVVNDIINKNLDLNHVYIANGNKDYFETLKRVFNNYNININLRSNSSLYDTKTGLELINHLNYYEDYINKIRNNDIKDDIINIINKYYWINDKNKVKDLIINDLKKTVINNKKYNNSVNVIELFDSCVNDDDYVYLIGFNREYIPRTFRDDDFIGDKDEPDYLDNTVSKNKNEYDNWIKVINNTKNLTISYSIQNLQGSLHPSPIIEDNKMETVKCDYKYSIHSNISNKYNLAVLLDDYYKYGTSNDNIEDLIGIYKNFDYLNYSNKFNKISLKMDNLRLSYSKMNTYYECAFKYYCDNILKLRPYEETFDTYLGSLCHFILSKIYDKHFDFDKVKEEFKADNKYELTLENKVFEDKMLNELMSAIKYIMKQYNDSLYKEVETEKNITIDKDGTIFIGIIDKIMKYDNKISLVDYKTGNTSIDIKLAKYGLNLQLPTYIWLIKSIYPDSQITGIYLEHIVKPNINEEFGKSLDSMYENHLKLCGYSLGDEILLNEFDPTYENSLYIKGMKMTKNGFSKYSKVLTNVEFDELTSLTDQKISECINAIKNADFNINPKIYANKNMSCDFCPYKSICFVTEKDNIILGGDDNE